MPSPLAVPAPDARALLDGLDVCPEHVCDGFRAVDLPDLYPRERRSGGHRVNLDGEVTDLVDLSCGLGVFPLGRELVYH